MVPTFIEFLGSQNVQRSPTPSSKHAKEIINRQQQCAVVEEAAI
jgi:hypothetical protein